MIAEVHERINALLVSLEPYLQMLANGQVSGLVAAELRQPFSDALARLTPMPADVRMTSTDMNGIRALVFTPDRITDNRRMLYIHGGGYISGSPHGYRTLPAQFARRLGIRVWAPDYRLAPEHPFPAALDDVTTAYEWMTRSYGEDSPILVGGDSAGGAMTVSMMVRARNAGLPMPRAGIAISPWADLEMRSASYWNREGLDPVASRAVLQIMARAALGPGGLPQNPEASPVNADVHGLPPILVQVGENEVMLSDAMRLAAHLGDSRVRTTLEVWPGMSHVWHWFSDILPQADQALDNACAFLNQAYPPSPECASIHG
jgi:epsilon-lactone hydrolase